MIDVLKKNIEVEIEILREVSICSKAIEFSSGMERKQLVEALSALQTSMRMINDAIPELLNASPIGNKLPARSIETSLEKVSFKRYDSDFSVGLRAKDKQKFLKEISISENLLKKVKKKPLEEKEVFEDFKAARGYLKLANKIFLSLAKSYISRGYFKPLYAQLKKANIDILFESYVAMMFFTTLLSAIFSIVIFVFFMMFNIGSTAPFVSNFSGNYLMRIVQTIWIVIAIPLATFFAVYIYPSTEKSSLSQRIDVELPFAVIHMSAISGSGIAPIEIFRIIGLSKEYPFLKREFRKVLNQINIYGYDLVNALNNVAKSTPSQKLAELFNGISTTINSGGGLNDFFEKRAETLLASYKLEREKFIKIAEIFMDIYISVVIATPMILMLLLVMMTISGFSTQLTPTLIGIVISLIVALINILFLAFLHIKQPSY